MGTGVSGGQQVVFVDGVSYRLSEIMAVGRLPDAEGTPETGGESDGEAENPDETVNETPET